MIKTIVMFRFAVCGVLPGRVSECVKEELGGDDSFMAWCASVIVTSVSVMACSPIHLEASARLASPSTPPDSEWKAAVLAALRPWNACIDLNSSSIR